MVNYWMHKPIDDSMTKEELIEIIEHLAEEKASYHNEISKMRPHVDWAAYLLDPKRK